ncbi:MAG: hypothetical protein JW808_11760 [Victivallales bacterium]|nr:hypothetical protein [Victivallales bacterium]
MPVDELPRFCQIAAGYRIKVVASTDIEKMLADYSPGTIDRVVGELVAKWRNLDALIGYVGFDEPLGMDLQVVNSMQDAFHRHDPARFFTVVSRPHEAPLAMHHLNADQICIDPYPFFHEKAPWNDDNSQIASKERHLTRLENVAYLRDKYRKSCWFMPQGFAEFAGKGYFDRERDQIAVLPGSFINWRMPTIEEYAWLIWSALVRGYNGIITFVLLPGGIPEKEDFLNEYGQNHIVQSTEWWGEKANVEKLTYIDKETALITRGLTPSPQMKKMSEIFAALSPLADKLTTARPLYPLVFSEKPYCTRTFTADDNGIIAVIVNDDLGGKRRGKLFLLPAVTRVTDLLTGKDVVIREDQGFGTIETELAPGEGTIIEIETGELTHSLLASFDFSAVEAQDQPLWERINCKLVNSVEGSGVPGLMPDDARHPAFLVKDFRDRFSRKFCPDRFKGQFFLYLEGTGCLNVACLDEHDAQLVAQVWKGIPFRLPVETKSIRIELADCNSVINRISIVYCEMDWCNE